MAEIVRVFLRLGMVAFGGPASHVALMHDELVRRRGWVGEQEFLDLNGATNLVPGPNSTELAMALGWRRGGQRGLVAAGLCFIVPAAVLSAVLAWVYVRWGTSPALTGILAGIAPVVVAVVLRALTVLAPTALRSRWLVVVGIAALAVYLAGVPELVVLVVATLAGAAPTLLREAQSRWRDSRPAVAWPALLVAAVGHGDTDRLVPLFTSLLRIALVLYGSGYVLLAYLRGDFVVQHAWVTEQQLLDAFAVGLATPGPVFTTATYLGFLVAGWLGAVVATVAIFGPAFLLTAWLAPRVHRLRRGRVRAALLDAVNVAALALMAGVTWQLGRAGIDNGWGVALAVGAAAVLWFTRVSSGWVLLGGAVVGLLVLRG